MINFLNATFIKSATSKEDRPNVDLPEILLVGKSNVGKSTLINCLTVKNSLAKTSKKPGYTKLLNYFNIDNKFYLVDAPGYGFADGGVDLYLIFEKMMGEYLNNNDHLKHILVLIDGRREMDDSDRELIDFIEERNIPYTFIITKADKLNQSEKSKLRVRIKEYGYTADSVVYTSKLMKESYKKLRETIENIF